MRHPFIKRIKFIMEKLLQNKKAGLKTLIRHKQNIIDIYLISIIFLEAVNAPARRV